MLKLYHIPFKEAHRKKKKKKTEISLLTLFSLTSHFLFPEDNDLQCFLLVCIPTISKQSLHCSAVSQFEALTLDSHKVRGSSAPPWTTHHLKHLHITHQGARWSPPGTCLPQLLFQQFLCLPVCLVSGE